MTEDGIYRIPQSNWEELQARIGKLAKRAAKLGCVPPALHVVGQETQREYQWNGPMWMDENTFASERLVYFTETPTKDGWVPTGRVRTMLLVRVEGEAPKLNGWTLAAVLQHLTAEDGASVNVLRIVPGIESVPEKYRSTTATCDHCQSIRRRNDTFVVKHEDGRWAQVGRQCLADFLGHQSPDKYAAMAEMLLEVSRFCSEAGEEGWGGSAGQSAWPLEYVLSITAAVVRKDGWCSKKSAIEYGKHATAATVMKWLTIVPKSEKDRAFVREYAPTDADKAQAVLVAEWLHEVAQRTDLNDYMYNLSAVARVGSVDGRLLGITCSAVATYLRETEQTAERKRRAEGLANSQFVGTVGERIENVRARLEFTRDFEGQFGVTHLYKFVTTDGNVLVWWASSEFEVGVPVDGGFEYHIIEVGNELALTFTVKKHEERDGVKQTVISRAIEYLTKDEKKARKQALEALLKARSA